MNEYLDDHELDELLASYALDAVDPDEARAIARYLHRDARAQAVVDADREIASLLVDGSAAAPVAGLDRLLAALEDAPEFAGPRDLVEGFGGPTHREQPGPAPSLRSVETPIASQGTRSIALRAGAALLAAAAVVVVALTAQVVRQHSELREQREELAALDERLSSDMGMLATRATQDPANRLTVLTSEDEAMVATAVVGSDGHGYLLADGLPALPDGRSYQLWGLIDDHAVSLGLLRGPGVIGFHVDAPMDGYALTQEDIGGTAAPTGAPLVVGLSEPR